MRIGILGPLEVRAGSGEPVEVAGARLRRLLVRLALDPGRVVTSAQLVDAVWDDHPPAGAANALQSLVSRLRRLLPDVLESSPSGYRLAVDAEAVDAVRFEALALAGRRQLGGDPGRPRDPAGGAGLWRGPALADAATAASPGRGRPAGRAAPGALEDRIDADLATGGHDRLVAELEELVAGHPLRSGSAASWCGPWPLRGAQADALGAYARLRARLADELGIDPSPELQAVHVAVLRGELAPRAPATNPDGPPAEPAAGPPAARTNLRAPITSFVGRDDDLARIMEAFGGARLVTLTGPGGAGKTRLAAEAAAGCWTGCPTGSGWSSWRRWPTRPTCPRPCCRCSGRASSACWRAARATAVPPLERLVEAIGDRQPAAGDRQLRAPGRRGVAALVDRPAGPLPGTAGAGHQPRAAGDRRRAAAPGRAAGAAGRGRCAGRGAGATRRCGCSPTGRAAARPGVRRRPGDRCAPVLRICRALDGMPLAIELAAARLRALAPEQIAARLDDRFRLLAGGSRPHCPATRRCGPSIDWSWELLGDAERVLLRRLAVFAGGATLEAAERVCAGPGIAGLAPTRCCTCWPRWSTSRWWWPDEADGRRGPLPDAGDGPGLRRGAAGARPARTRRCAGPTPATSSSWPSAAEPELRRGDQLRWIARLSAERDNLHAALRWAVDSGDGRRWPCGWSPRSAGTGS